MDLSIIIVNWNSTDYLRACLASVYRYTQGVSFEVIVIDNASTEGDVTCLQDEFPNVSLIKSDKNLGFAGANNLGFRHSMSEYILLLNPDTELLEPSINILLEHIKKLPDAGIVGCKLLNTDRTVQISSIQRFPSILNQVIDVEYLRLKWPHFPLWRIGPLFANVKVLPVEVIPGACMLLKRSVFQQVGMLSEEYFMYAEDLDLNRKLKNAGFTSYYVGETAIVHHGGRSSAQHTVSHWSRLMQCSAMRRYFRKSNGRWYEWLYQVAVGFAALVRLIIVLILSFSGRLFPGRESLRAARRKWWAVLKWAVGADELAVQK